VLSLLSSAAIPTAAAAAFSPLPEVPRKGFNNPESYEVVGSALPEGYVLPPCNIDTDSLLRAQGKFSQQVLAIIKPIVREVPYEQAIRLAIMDAGVYDRKALIGADGSVHLSEELARAENAGLKDLLAVYEKAKAEVDKESAIPIGYADLIAVGARIVSCEQWKRDFAGKTDRFEKRRQWAVGAGADMPLLEILGNADFRGKFATLYSSVDPQGVASDNPNPVKVGRVDATVAAPDGRIPKPGASSDEWKVWAARCRLSPNELVALAPFLSPDGNAEAVLREDGSLKTFFAQNDLGGTFPGTVEGRITRALNNMSLNASFDSEKYIVPKFFKGGGWQARSAIPSEFELCRQQPDGTTACKNVSA